MDGRSSRAVRGTLQRTAGAACLALVATLSACGGYEPPDLTTREPIRVDSTAPSSTAPPSSSPRPSGDASATGAPSPSATASAAEPPAVAAARVAAAAGRGTPVAVERVDDGPSWEFTVVDAEGREVVVAVAGDPAQVQGGPVVSVDDDDDAEDRQLVASARVGMARAVRAALRTQPGARLESAKLDEDDGVAAWEIELSSGAEVLVDARTGMVRVED